MNDHIPGPTGGNNADTTGDLERSDFIRAFVREDLAAGRNDGRVHTRFPPEPNGYLHIGHAKAIMISWTLAEEFGGKFNLRFDDTNPEKEDVEYVESIKHDVRWLGADWEDREFYASDYFDQLYAWAQHLIREGKAYVCSLDEEQIRAMARHRHRGGQAQPRPRPAGGREPGSARAHARRASSPRAPTPCGRRSTWRMPT